MSQMWNTIVSASLMNVQVSKEHTKAANVSIQIIQSVLWLSCWFRHLHQ